jgi:hypothetical protein
MEKTIRVFKSSADAEEADKKYYRSLTPSQRIEFLLTLRDQCRPYSDELTEGFKRVYRIIKRT